MAILKYSFHFHKNELHILRWRPLKKGGSFEKVQLKPARQNQVYCHRKGINFDILRVLKTVKTYLFLAQAVIYNLLNCYFTISSEVRCFNSNYLCIACNWAYLLVSFLSRGDFLNSQIGGIGGVLNEERNFKILKKTK